MDLKIINSVTFSPEIAKSLKRRAKQQRWRLWYFVIICFPFFSQKQNALVFQRTPQFGPSLLLKRIEKIINKLHNGGNDSHKRQFSALGVRSQSWKLDNLSKKKFLSNWLVLQAACYNLTEKIFAQIISVTSIAKFPILESR